MIQYRRLAALVLGVWLGAGAFADVAVTQNFQTVDRFLAKPGSILMSQELNRIGRAREREILRRNAGEENNSIFENWERVEIVLGSGLFLLLLFGSRPHKLMLLAAIAMTLTVLVQHFLISPLVADLGRRITDLPMPADPKKTDPLVARFWTLHGIYSGSEILKLLIGFALALRFSIRPKHDPDHFVKEYESDMAVRKRK